MNKEFDLISWNNIKSELKKTYPQLTNADLYWRQGSKEDVLRMIAQTLRITRKELGNW